jgi:hypothetical protein
MGNIFIVGSGLITVDMEDVTYTNQPLYSGMKYDVFCRAVGTAATGGLTSTSDGHSSLLEPHKFLRYQKRRQTVHVVVVLVAVTQMIPSWQRQFPPFVSP